MSYFILFIVFPIYVSYGMIESAIVKDDNLQTDIEMNGAPEVKLETEPHTRHYVKKALSEQLNLQPNRRNRRNIENLYVEPPIRWSHLRQYICGAGNDNCLNNDRISKFPPDIWRQLSKIRDTPSAASDADWSPKDGFIPPPNYSSDVNILNSVNLSGRREGPLYVDEPRFITLNDEELLGSDKLDDPFIPMRGKKDLVDDDDEDIERTFLLGGIQANHPVRNIKWLRKRRLAPLSSDYDSSSSIRKTRQVTESQGNNLRSLSRNNGNGNSNHHFKPVKKWCCRDKIKLSHILYDEDNVLTDSNQHKMGKRSLQNNLSQENRDSTFYLARGSQAHLNA